MRQFLPLAVVACLFGCLHQADAQTVFISEFVASNQDSLADEDGDSPDWLELFNSGETPIDLDGWYLTDDPALLNKWQIPGVTLPAGQFIVIFASDKNRRDPESELHTNFKLSAGGDYLALVRADGVTVEHDYGPVYPAQITDVSYGVGMSGGSSVLVDQGSTLRYRIPTGGGDDVDDGLNPSPWIGAGFNDTSWSSGSLGIGYARAEPDAYDQYILTDIESQMDGVHPGVYVRVEFELADPSAIQGLTLRMRYDDGFVAYLNGQPEPVAAANAPAASAVNWQSTATANQDDSSAVDFQDFQLGDAPLLPGTNVLAIHGLNTSSGSSDLLIAPQLVASTDAALNGEVNYFTAPTPDATNGDASDSPGPLVKGVPETVAPPQVGGTGATVIADSAADFSG
ncbi:MAG: lamin tail domain-containing protein, partial [Verrucomicrobiales bacterium]